MPVEAGPEDLRDLPRHFGQDRGDRPAMAATTSRSSPRSIMRPGSSWDELIRQAERFRSEGADVIDLGCDPGSTWRSVGEAVTALRDRGMRVSIDSFDPAEVGLAVSAGAELVLSVNASNREQRRRLGCRSRGDPGRARLARGPRRDHRIPEPQGRVSFASTRSSSRSALASRLRSAAISKSAAAIPKRR